MKIFPFEPNPHALLPSALVILSVFSSLVPAASAQTRTRNDDAPLAARPPMGWNSWDSYALTVTEPQFRANIDVLAHTLKPFGWRYAVIDEGWFLRNPEDRSTPDKLQYELDQTGRYIPVPARYPSAGSGGKNTGFTTMSAYVHSLGLQFGIHIVRGIPRESVTRNLPVADSSFTAKDVADMADACPWDPTNWGVRDTPAGQAWYDSLMKQYASWGVDYIKVDCISDHPYKGSEIRQIHRAILHSGRPMILSLSPGPTALSHAQEVSELSQMWRISEDFWDVWKATGPFPWGVSDQFNLLDKWSPYAKPGHWPDADMLPLGFLGPIPGDGKPARPSRLTHDEQRTLFTLWAIARSPLILGANLTKLDDWTLSLLTNRDVLDVNQFGHNQKQAAHDGDLIAWTSEGADHAHYLALFNLGEKELTVTRPFKSFNLPSPSFTSTDLWSHSSHPSSDSLNLTLPPHGCTMLKLM